MPRYLSAEVFRAFGEYGKCSYYVPHTDDGDYLEPWCETEMSTLDIDALHLAWSALEYLDRRYHEIKEKRQRQRKHRRRATSRSTGPAGR